MSVEAAGRELLQDRVRASRLPEVPRAPRDSRLPEVPRAPRASRFPEEPREARRERGTQAPGEALVLIPNLCALAPVAQPLRPGLMQPSVHPPFLTWRRHSTDQA